MSRWVGETLAALSYAGAGAAVGSIGAALISSRSGKAEARAHAADLITNAAGALADRLATLNAKLDHDNSELRKSISMLSAVIDEMIPKTQATAAEKAKWRKALRNAQLSL